MMFIVGQGQRYGTERSHWQCGSAMLGPQTCWFDCNCIGWQDCSLVGCSK